MYYLLNHRPNGINTILGAGIATIAVDTSVYPPVPTATRLPGRQYWWDGSCEPWYGDTGAIKTNGFIYAYGHANSTPYVYLTRVPWQQATDLSCYEYWNGSSWQAERLYSDGRNDTTPFGETEGIFWQVNQGQVIYNDYYDCYVFVYSGKSLPGASHSLMLRRVVLIAVDADNFLDSKILTRTAPAPEGPWSEDVTLFQATPLPQGSSTYAAAPQPEFDPSGKTLIVTFTNDPNVIQAIKVVCSSSSLDYTSTFSPCTDVYLQTFN